MPGGRKRLFSKELRCMMFGFGDDQNPYTESVDLLEDLVIEFITEMTHRAMEIGRTGRVQVEDIVFLGKWKYFLLIRHTVFHPRARTLTNIDTIRLHTLSPFFHIFLYIPLLSPVFIKKKTSPFSLFFHVRHPPQLYYFQVINKKITFKSNYLFKIFLL